MTRPRFSVMTIRVLRGAMVLSALLLTACAAFSLASREYSLALRSQRHSAHGAEVLSHCVSCHGRGGEGTEDGKVPRIAGQHFQVLIKQLIDYRHAERSDRRMERVADRHSLKDTQAIVDVAAYVSQLESTVHAHPAEPTLGEPGAQVYARLCQSCHGDGGEGNAEKRVPRLAGQRYEYLARQIYYMADLRRPNISNRHLAAVAQLSREEILDVADYLSRSGWNRATPRPPSSQARARAAVAGLD